MVVLAGLLQQEACEEAEGLGQEEDVERLVDRVVLVQAYLASRPARTRRDEEVFCGVWRPGL